MSRYTFALAVFAAAVLLRFLARDTLGLKVPYLQFFPAIIIAAWYGGLGPGLLVTALSSVVAVSFLLPPLGPSLGDPADLLSLVVFVATGVAISWLNHRLLVLRPGNARRRKRPRPAPNASTRFST